MTNTKTTDGMRYEATKVTNKVTNKTLRANRLRIANELSTLSLIWLLVRRHRVALLAVGNVVLVLNWAFPQWLELLRSL